MMERRNLKGEETSSGYSSRESISDAMIVENTERSNSTCSCGKSNSERSYLTPKYEKNKQSRSSSKLSNNNSNQHLSISGINEKLIQQNRQLQEQNQSLLEELQISRRFYQGSLAELTSQLSIAESRTKYLEEIVNAHRDYSELSKKDGDLLPSLRVFKDNLSLHDKHNDCQKKQSQPLLANNHVVTSIKQVSRPASVVSTGSHANARGKLTLRQKVNMTKIKEELLQKNQQMKSDIANLKVKTDLPRSSSVPLISPNISKNH